MLNISAASVLTADGGMAERAERYIITLLGAGLTGLGVPYAFDVALWLLAGLQLVMVSQRMVSVRRSAAEGEARRAESLTWGTRPGGGCSALHLGI